MRTPALALLLILGACGADNDKAKRPIVAPPTVTVAQVVEQPLPGGLVASGRLVPREEVGVAAELGGFRVANVAVEEDAIVRRGQTLAVLDTALLESQIAQARAALAQQQVAAERANSEAARVIGLDNQGVISNEAIQQRRLAARSSDAAVAVANAQLRDLLVRRDRLVIRAPTAGRVLERTIRPGDTSAAGSVMFRIARDNLIELYAEIPDADVGTVRLGDPAQVTLASGARLSGTVRLIGARVDDRTGLAIARIALPVRDELRAGGFAQAHFTRDSAPTRLVPEAAIHFDSDGASMQVVGTGDKIHRVTVRTGRRAKGLVELIEGPAVGSRVVLAGGAFVLEGDRVRTVAAGAGR